MTTALDIKPLTNGLLSHFADNSPINYNLEIVASKEMPELSIFDYLMWAIQRKLLLNESRYFNALKNKYETVINLYGEG